MPKKLTEKDAIARLQKRLPILQVAVLEEIKQQEIKHYDTSEYMKEIPPGSGHFYVDISTFGDMLAKTFVKAIQIVYKELKD